MTSTNLYIYITNISHITQSDKDKVHKFTYIYMCVCVCVCVLLILATSHKVTKTKFLIKPKQLDQRLGQLVTKKVTYDLPKTSLHS